MIAYLPNGCSIQIPSSIFIIPHKFISGAIETNYKFIVFTDIEHPHRRIFVRKPISMTYFTF